MEEWRSRRLWVRHLTPFPLLPSIVSKGLTGETDKVCYNAYNKRTYAMLFHRPVPPATTTLTPPEAKNQICANAWFVAERLSPDEVKRVGF